MSPAPAFGAPTYPEPTFPVPTAQPSEGYWPASPPPLPDVGSGPPVVRRLRWLVWTALVLVVVTPVLFGLAVFGWLTTRSLVSITTLDLGGGWIPALVGLGLAVLLAFAMAVAAVIWTRPRTMAVVVLLLSVVLPVISVWLSVKLGLAVLAQRMSTDLDGAAEAVEGLSGYWDRAQGEPGPVGDLLRTVSGWVP